MAGVRLTGDIVRLEGALAEYLQASQAAVTAGVAAATAGLVTDLRQQIGSAFPGSRRLPTAITGRAYPNGGRVSLGAAGWVRPRGERVGQVLEAHREGAVIRPRNGGAVLAIPTERVPRIGGRRMTPDEVRRRFGQHLDLIPARSRGGRYWGALVLRNHVVTAGGRVRAPGKRSRARAQTVVMFILVPQVTLPQRLDPDGLHRQWADRVPALIEQAMGMIGGGR